MTTNRLAKPTTERVKLTPLEIVAQGNEAIRRVGRTDIEWVLRGGFPVIQTRGS